MTAFEDCFDRLIGNEGGYVNDPQDPGGETNWGISKRSYPDLNIKTLTRDQAKNLYFRDFWQKNQMGQLQLALAFQVFDAAVNHGNETAARLLQRAAKVADDGHIGPVTLAAIKSQKLSSLLMLFVAERLDFWRKLTKWSVYGAGWAGRAVTDLRYAAGDIDE